ncbi:protein STRUBBELIG-RECEPTOR FAMILY 1-like isoform X2 [Phragmites australis]|uniref:protein STRUBBELIG-RECEPTOR FAMILY 1-like isoform X2 n=1 Tax=Phragmites australis TaxID=29695 RepID=UPI002D795139|nr:protein STRUBBELIG-RECEPTOR FAMILY 1-like isoform X2 [Phragmites australis]
MRSRTHLRVTLWLAVCLLRLHAFPFPLPFSGPYTSQQDVDAINGLYASLGSPELDGWAASGGDPCKEAWQGVQCDGPNITAIELRGAGLGGKLSETLGDFTAITRLDLSNNQIGGTVPQSFPPAITQLDLSSNNLSGELPDSMAKLSSLSTLNVENNLLSGPIPKKLLSIPKFLRSGNHFTIPPIPGFSPTPATPPPLEPSPSPAPQESQALSGSHPPIYVIPATPQDDPPRHNHKVSPAKAAGFSILAAGSLSIVVVVIVFAVSKWRREGSLHGGYLRGAEMSLPNWVREPPRLGAVAKPEKRLHSAAEEKIEWPPRDYVKAAGSSVQPSFKNSSKDSIVSDKNIQGSSAEQPLQFPFTFFTVASLQQYTNSFSDQYLARETCFGKIYQADHQGSKFAVLKLEGNTAKMPIAEFLKIVQGISRLRHPNVEKLVGCCVEHGQRLLVYKHFSDSTLSDMMHFDLEDRVSDPAEMLPWDARIAVALEAAKALEYLHEGSQLKQVVHRHFRPEHVLIDSELRVSVSGGGLAPFVPPGLALELSDYCGGTLSYEPPEAAGGSAAWTAKGDVYSFGVVMLQLLTGRKPYDGSRERGERHLVPWASPRLYDLAALRRMADPRLGGDGQPPVRSLSRFADIIGRCIQQEAEFRPGMSQVVQDLRRALDDAHARAGCSVEEA